MKKQGGQWKDIKPPAIRVWQHWLFISVISMVTFACYQPALNNKLLKTWDDPVYVTNNKLLDSLSVKKVGEIFSFNTEFQQLSNNYHPLTTLSLALNHYFSGLNPRPYHFTNIFIHILNSILVYLLVFLLADRRTWAALLAGLLFAVHPMHVESVAWVSERKDVLYAFFFISGMILYYFYLRKNSYKSLALVFLFFFLSVLSKAMAVVFPLVMLLMDFLLNRRWSWRLFLEKVPFFLVSALFGIIAVRVQAQGAINDWQTFTLYQRFIHASYGFLSYLYNFFIPFGLSAFNPYPFINEHGVLPWAFRAAPFIFLAIMALTVWSLFARSRMIKIFGIGMLFYLFTIALVLQFISVGRAITADRYTYIPYIGILFILGSWISWLTDQKKPVLKYAGFAAGALMLVFSVVSAVQCSLRSAVWHDDITLWTDALDQYSDVRMNFIRLKRANQFFENSDFQNAMKDYQVIASSEPSSDEALGRIGQICGQQFHQIDSALYYLNRAYLINPNEIILLKNLGVAYGIRGEYGKSQGFFLQAYAKDPADSMLMLNIAANYRGLGDMENARRFENMAHKAR